MAPGRPGALSYKGPKLSVRGLLRHAQSTISPKEQSPDDRVVYEEIMTSRRAKRSVQFVNVVTMGGGPPGKGVSRMTSRYLRLASRCDLNQDLLPFDLIILYLTSDLMIKHN